MDAKRAALFEESTRDFLRKSLGKDVSLRRLKSFETRPLFKMTDSGGDSAFVKVTTCAETAKRAYALLSRTSLPFMPRAKFLFEREGRFVMGMSWMEGRVVPPE